MSSAKRKRGGLPRAVDGAIRGGPRLHGVGTTWAMAAGERGFGRGDVDGQSLEFETGLDARRVRVRAEGGEGCGGGLTDGIVRAKPRVADRQKGDRAGVLDAGHKLPVCTYQKYLHASLIVVCLHHRGSADSTFSGALFYLGLRFSACQQKGPCICQRQAVGRSRPTQRRLAWRGCATWALLIFLSANRAGQQQHRQSRPAKFLTPQLAC